MTTPVPLHELDPQYVHAKAVGRDIGAEYVGGSGDEKAQALTTFAVDRLTNGFGMDPRIADSAAFWHGVEEAIDEVRS